MTRQAPERALEPRVNPVMVPQQSVIELSQGISNGPPLEAAHFCL